MQNRHREVFKLIKQHRFRFYAGMVCMVLVALGPPAQAYLIKIALNDVFFNKDITMLTYVPVAAIVVFLILGIGMYGQEYFMGYIGQSIIRELRDRLYNKISDLPISFFYKEKTGVLMSRVTNDVTIIKQMVSTSVVAILEDTLKIIFLTGYVFYQIWELALIAFIVLPLAFYPIFIIGKLVRRISTRNQEAMAELSSFLHETFAGNIIVKAFGMEEYEKKRFYDKAKKLFKIELKMITTGSLNSPIMEFLGGIGAALIIWYGGYKVIAGVYDVGTFFSFLAAVFMLYTPVKKLSKINNVVQQGLAATDRVFDIIETQSEIREDNHPTDIEIRPHRVTFNNVFFKYEYDSVLNNINLDVRPGEVLALVGMSGGGKTSMVNLIPRFYDVCDGAVLIDGINIKNISISSLRKQIAIVTQTPILFNDTVRNNIAYGNLDASEEQILNAAKAAYAHDFIQNFPEKYETFIGELGSRLSGGEKQRICIARALLKDAPILILDEATSSLDTESEMLVQKALENLMKGRTTFVIAHRLSTISRADRIIVIVDGRIVEEGRHDELLSKQGEYYKLYQMQFSNAK